MHWVVSNGMSNLLNGMLGKLQPLSDVGSDLSSMYRIGWISSDQAKTTKPTKTSISPAPKLNAKS